MSLKNISRNINSFFLNILFSVNEKQGKDIGNPKRILIIRQHNQFGDMLATIPMFRAIKEKYPRCELTIIASPNNYRALENNSLIDELFVFDQKKLFKKKYFVALKNIIRGQYDVVIVPVTIAISSTSCILAAMSDAKIKIGPRSLNGKKNPLDKLFHYRIDLDWRKFPDSHVSDFIQEIVRPFGISFKDFSSMVKFDESHTNYAKDFIKKIGRTKEELLIGIHIGAAKPQNRWSLDKYIELIGLIFSRFSAKIYLTGSDADKELLDYMKKNCLLSFHIYETPIPELTAMIELSNLFITNDTGVMHVAGTCTTPLISIFGPTNPFNWAPVGNNKYFIRKSELIDDVSVTDVMELVQYVLELHKGSYAG